jgi:hypothetical protein
MKTINLREIFDSSLIKWELNLEPFNSESSLDDAYLYAMHEACNQTIDLCAENTDTDKDKILATKSQII